MDTYLIALAIIAIIIIAAVWRRGENMYASWYWRSNYPIGEYDPAMASGNQVRNP